MKKRTIKSWDEYEIIQSGSSGNCVIVGDMMFDCGVPYSKVRKHLYEIKYLFITHRHSDHLNTNTFRAIKKEFPRIKVIANWDVAYQVPVDNIVGDDTEIKLKDRTITSFSCPHDVVCHGFTVQTKKNTMIYATDTTTLENAPKLEYDFLFIESNHDENKIRAIQNTSRKLYGYDAWEGAMRHLSTQQSKAFYYMYRKDESSEWVELHKSERFY